MLFTYYFPSTWYSEGCSEECVWCGGRRLCIYSRGITGLLHFFAAPFTEKTCLFGTVFILSPDTLAVFTLPAPLSGLRQVSCRAVVRVSGVHGTSLWVSAATVGGQEAWRYCLPLTPEMTTHLYRLREKCLCDLS